MSEERIRGELRRIVVARAQDCCEYCYSQARFATQAFSIEHVVPRSKGGATTSENLALSCQGCNNHKYNKVAGHDPVSGQTVSLFHPREQRWKEHCAWNDDYTLIIGITSTGRATIETLQLNRAGLVNLRRVLYAMGEHPPLIKASDA